MKKKVCVLFFAGVLCLVPQTIFAEEVFAQSENAEQPEDRAAYYNITENGGSFEADESGDYHYILDGKLIKNAFFCDGTYTYYLQNDGTPMKDRLTYHPDGEHIIYFDQDGHEVFDCYAQITKSIEGNPVDDTCYFGTYGYMYMNQIAFSGEIPYYYNVYGVRQENGWFQFADGNFGYADRYGILAHNTFGYNPFGQKIFFQWDGTVARGLIADEFYYYLMDETDGHLIGAFSKDSGIIPAWEPAQSSMIPLNTYDFYILGDNCITRNVPNHDFLAYMESKYAPTEDWRLWIYQTEEGGAGNSETHNNDTFITNRGIMLGAEKDEVLAAYGPENSYSSGTVENGKISGNVKQKAYEELPQKEPEAYAQLNQAVTYGDYCLYGDSDETRKNDPMPYLYRVYAGIRFYYDENDKVIMIEYYYDHYGE